VGVKERRLFAAPCLSADWAIRMSRSNLTEKLRGYTDVAQMNFITELPSGISSLTLQMRKPSPNSHSEIFVRFSNVSKLTIKDLGGGISQFLLLTIDDISDDQLDRINFRVHELEEDSISFFCQSIAFESIP
jgi:hypothetical protein